MKTKTLILTVFLLPITILNAQEDSLFNALIDQYHPAGFIYFKPNALQPGEPFTIYEEFFFNGAENTMELKKQEYNSALDMEHYRYQQYYKGIEVEAAEFTEHADETGYLSFANGKVVQDINQEVPEVTNEDAALNALLATMPEHTFAWQDSATENELKLLTGDSNATYYPTGSLIWTLDNYANLSYDIPASRYQLCYAFSIKCLAPSFDKTFYVNVNDNTIYRTDDDRFYDGPAITSHHGTQTIDTQWKGGFTQKHILKANTNGHNFHTRRYKDGIFKESVDVKDDDDNWGDSQQPYTDVHWWAGEAWDYFYSEYGIKGSNYLGKLLEIHVDYDNKEPTEGTYMLTKKVNPSDIMWVGNYNDNYLSSLDIIGHEYTHAIIAHSAALKNSYESGALGESFSDIFGIMIERRTEGTLNDWHIGEDANVDPEFERSLDVPNSMGYHFQGGNCNNRLVGQPDTYESTYWEFGNCDRGGVHVNNGVQNHWFYLLANGGSGVNDNGFNYNIQGIGLDKAANIAYLNMTTVLQSGAQYADAAQGAITMAIKLYGACSIEHYYCANAWAAVGVGQPIQCGTLNIETADRQTVHLAPNPATSILNLKFNSSAQRSITITDLTGKVVLESTSGNEEKQISISNLNQGVYFITVQNKQNIGTFKFVKNE